MKKLEVIGKRQYKGQYTIIIPVIVIATLAWLVFWLIPNFGTFFYAFQDMNGNWTFDNFREMWRSLTTGGGSLAISFKNTFTFFFLGVFVDLPLTLIVVYFCFKKIAGYKFFRIIFYLPAIISSVALTGVFKSFIATNGPLGKICESIGIYLPNEGLLGTVETAIDTIVAYHIWTCVSSGLLLLSGTMGRIPVEILESAKLEGCGVGRELVNIIIPLMWPTISTMVIMKVAGIISATGPILLLQPDPLLGTSTLSYWMFRQVYGNGGYGGTGQYGLVSAMGTFFTLIVIPLTLFCRHMAEKVPAVEY